MSAGQYINEDGTVKEEILAMQELAKVMSAQKHGYERSYIDQLIAEVEEKGFVILHDIISKELIEKQGGKIWVESQLGTGTVFHIALPIP